VGESLARGELVEPFGTTGRVGSPYAYWLVRWPARREREVLAAFELWVLAQAEFTRAELAGVPALARGHPVVEPEMRPSLR
jgi:LysR family glycine cleavage system transcriptional activator